MGKKILITIGVAAALAVAAFASFNGYLAYITREMAILENGNCIDSVYALKGSMGNMYLVKSGDTWVGFDASDKPEMNLTGCRELGIDPAKVKAIFLTHSDADHVNGLPAFPGAKVYVSKDEVPVITGEKPRQFLWMKGPNKLPVEEYKTLSNGDSVTVGNITVHAIATTGHTAGSMSFRVDESLFAGDLCLIIDDKIECMVEAFTEDMKQDSISIAEVAKRSDYTRIFTAHSGLSTAKERVFKGWM